MPVLSEECPPAGRGGPSKLPSAWRLSQEADKDHIPVLNYPSNSRCFWAGNSKETCALLRTPGLPRWLTRAAPHFADDMVLVRVESLVQVMGGYCCSRSRTAFRGCNCERLSFLSLGTRLSFGGLPKRQTRTQIPPSRPRRAFSRGPSSVRMLSFHTSRSLLPRGSEARPRSVSPPLTQGAASAAGARGQSCGRWRGLSISATVCRATQSACRSLFLLGAGGRPPRSHEHCPDVQHVGTAGTVLASQ